MNIASSDMMHRNEAAMKRWTMGLLMLLGMLDGCAAHKPFIGPPQRMTSVPCGTEITWTDDKSGKKSTWVYPCWPQDTKPRCVKGCEDYLNLKKEPTK